MPWLWFPPLSLASLQDDPAPSDARPPQTTEPETTEPAASGPVPSDTTTSEPGETADAKTNPSEKSGPDPATNPAPVSATAGTPTGPLATTVAPTQRPLEAHWLDWQTNWFLGGVLGLLVAAFVLGRVLRRQPERSVDPAVVRVFNQRVRSWWLMTAVLLFGFLFQRIGTVVLFGLVSFWALREYITMTPTRRGDHRALFWSFFAILPAQYILVGLGQAFYGVYSILIPVYASLIIPARIAFSGDAKRFLERVAKIQAGLLICVYSLSYAPALLDLNLQRSDGADWIVKSGGVEKLGSPVGLLFYFVLLSQLADVFSFSWGKLLGQNVIAPAINASRTWEGLIGGVLSTALVGSLLFPFTPFTLWESACVAAVVAFMGFAGAMTMSAIKRDRGVKDYGTLVTGHAGVLDRIDSICFAAPVFFHMIKMFFAKA